jgi:probable O-glycosylation ligase (exosortase A-associated)
VRDIILLAALLAVIPFIVRVPIAGLLAWIWITLMNPQREVYSFLAGFPLNFGVAVGTIAVWAASKERKAIPANPFTVALVVFSAWCCVTTLTALYPPYARPMCTQTLKTVVLALAVATLANTRARIQAVLWALAVSLGYYGVKGGGFVIATGGHSRVFGPDNTMISDNNCLALVLIVMLPLLAYLRATSRVKLTRLALLGALLLGLLAIFGTYSRGALVALAASGAVYAMRSRYALLLVLVAGILVAFLPSFMPASWSARMSTLQTYNQDESFAGRVAAWKTSSTIAAARPLTGGGFHAVEINQVVAQFPTPGGLTHGKAAHSIYFEVLGDHGYIGLALYLLVLAAAWVNTFMVLDRSRKRPDLDWAGQLARMLQVCLVAFMIGGAALSMAYYDGMMVVLALTAALAETARRPAAAAAGALAQPQWKQAAASAAPLEPVV